MKTKFTVFDPSEFLDAQDAIEDHLAQALETGDARVIAGALGDVARARGMSELARQTGMSRESLYRALSEDGNPRLDTLTKVLSALGVRLSVSSIDAAE